MGIVHLPSVAGRTGGDTGGHHSTLDSNQVSSTANGSERASRIEAMIIARRHRSIDRGDSPLLLCSAAVVSDPRCSRGRKLALTDMTASLGLVPRSGTDRRQ